MSPLHHTITPPYRFWDSAVLAVGFRPQVHEIDARPKQMHGHSLQVFAFLGVFSYHSNVMSMMTSRLDESAVTMSCPRHHGGDVVML